MKQMGLCAVWVAVLVCGCSDNSRTTESGSVESAKVAGSTLEGLMNEVNEHLAADHVARAIVLLEDAAERADMAEHRAMLAHRAAVLYFRMDPFRQALRIGEAYSAATGEAVPLPLIRDAGDYLLSQAMYSQAEQWGASLRDSTEDANVRLMTWAWHCRAAVLQKQSGVLADAMPEMLAKLPAEEVARLLQDSIKLALRMGQRDEISEVIDALEKTHGDVAALKPVLLLGKVDVRIQGADIEGAADLLLQNAELVNDRAAQQRLQSCVRKLSKNIAAADGLAQRIVTTLKGKPLTVATVGRLWVDQALKAENFTEALSRLEKMRTVGVDANSLRRTYESAFYEVMATANVELQKRCAAFGISIPLEQLRDDGASLYLVRLDATFYLNDFDASLKILEGGVPGKDEQWHAMLINKVKAHKAETAGNYEDAISGYRRHMDFITAMEDSVSNPLTGQMVENDSVLAFNEKRIGNLYLKWNKPEDAAASFAKARSLYASVLKAMPETDPRRADMQKELASVPKAATEG